MAYSDFSSAGLFLAATQFGPSAEIIAQMAMTDALETRMLAELDQHKKQVIRHLEGTMLKPEYLDAACSPIPKDSSCN